MGNKVEMKYGEFIRSLRKDLKISQEQLGEKIGCSVFIIAKWEANESYPDVSLLGNLCRELKVDLTSFINCKKELNNTYCVDRDYSTAAIGEMLGTLRKEKHMSQKSLSADIEIAYQKISRYETGGGIIPFPEFIKFAEYFQVSYETLYFNLQETLDEQIDNRKNGLVVKTRFYEVELVLLGLVLGVVLAVLIVFLIGLFS